MKSGFEWEILIEWSCNLDSASWRLWENKRGIYSIFL